MKDGRIVEVMGVAGVEGSRVLFGRCLPLHDTVLKRYRVAQAVSQRASFFELFSSLQYLDTQLTWDLDPGTCIVHAGLATEQLSVANAALLANCSVSDQRSVGGG